MDTATAFFYVALGCVVLLAMCALDALVTRLAGPDRDLQGPWDPRR